MNLAIESCFMNASFVFLLGITAAQQFPGDSRQTAPKFIFGNRLGAEPTHVLGNPGRSLGKRIQRRAVNVTLPNLEAGVDGAVSRFLIGLSPETGPEIRGTRRRACSVTTSTGSQNRGCPQVASRVLDQPS